MENKHQTYIRDIPGSKTAVLFLHGILGSPNHFRHFLPLVPKNWSIFNILLDGHGKTVQDFSKTSMAKWEHQVSEIIARLCREYENILLVGHSMGTLFSIDGGISYPTQVKALFLLNVPLKIAAKPASFTNSLKVAFDRVPADDLMASAAKAAYSIAPCKQVWRYAAWIPRYLELFSKIRETREKLTAISVPCYIFMSKNDELVSFRSISLLRKIPTAETIILENSSHSCYEQNDLRQILEKFGQVCAEMEKTH